jgi:ribosomal protein L12E/L44/L45/RPP1/RPP2
VNPEQVQQEVVTSVCFVSRDGKSRLALARHPLIQDQIISLAESGNVEVARHCVGCLANLLEDIQTHDLLVEPDDSVLASTSSAGAVTAATNNGEENNGNEGEAEEGVGAVEKKGEEKQKDGEKESEDEEEEGSGVVTATVAVQNDYDNTNMAHGNGDHGENVGKSCESTLLRLLEHTSVLVHREAARGISNLLTSVHYQHRTIK